MKRPKIVQIQAPCILHAHVGAILPVDEGKDDRPKPLTVVAHPQLAVPGPQIQILSRRLGVYRNFGV